MSLIVGSVAGRALEDGSSVCEAVGWVVADGGCADSFDECSVIL
jgi:hypothetical protein